MNRSFLLAPLWLLLVVSWAQAQPDQLLMQGEKLLVERCSGCHQRSDENQFSRISEQRKSPEGWFMTVVRMQRAGRVSLSDDERRSLVKYLSDNHGLSPQESAPHRYALEKRPNWVEASSDPDLETMCARCHTQARFKLQRRSEEEWRRLVHFHVAQFPTLEYAAGSRERDWWGIATGPLLKQLSRDYGLNSESWKQWQRQPEVDLSGRWRVVGTRPGRGSYQGFAEILRVSQDQYQATYHLRDEQGNEKTYSSEALLYNGYEWRGETLVDQKTAREVFSVSADRERISGRWFFQEHDETGGDWIAARMGQSSQLLAVQPGFLKAGSRQQITIIGSGLKGALSLGEGISVTVKQRSADRIVADVIVGPQVVTGRRDVQVGETRSQLLSVYRRLDSLQVEPAQAIARVGGGGGKLPAVPVQFEAVGYLNGTDGEPNTEDDIRIGTFSAQWSSSDYDEVSTMLQDSEFAGRIDASGRFQPAEAGINPERYIPTNNIGVLKIQANVDDGDETLSASARLVVTVQRFVDPPIR